MEANLAEDYPEETDETKESIEDNIVVAFIAQGVDIDVETGLVADATQSEVIAFFARERARGKGFPMHKNFKFPGNRMKTSMTLEGRKAKLSGLKANSTCKNAVRDGILGGGFRMYEETSRTRNETSMPDHDVRKRGQGA